MNNLKALLLCLVVLNSFSTAAQIVVRTNLLHTIPLNKSLSFELRILKGSSTGFGELEIKSIEQVRFRAISVASAVAVEEIDYLSLRWEVLPTDSQLILKFKVAAVHDPVMVDLTFRYADTQDDVKREFVSQPFRLSFKDTTLPKVMTVKLEQLKSTEEPAIPLPPIVPANVLKKLPTEVDQQVEQLRRDSERALAVGTLEKERVQSKLDTLQKSMLALGDTAGDPGKAEAYASLEAKKIKAEGELEVAERVLTLSKTLDDQATEIARISRESLNDKKKPKVAVSAPKPERTNLPPEKSNEQPIPMIGTVTDKGLVFMVQIGAFKNMPKLDDLQKAGSVMIVKDNNVFKALHGSFTNKDSALARCKDLQTLFPGCFIVAYQDGEKVK